MKVDQGLKHMRGQSVKRQDRKSELEWRFFNKTMKGVKIGPSDS